MKVRGNNTLFFGIEIISGILVFYSDQYFRRYRFDWFDSIFYRIDPDPQHSG